MSTVETQRPSSVAVRGRIGDLEADVDAVYREHEGAPDSVTLDLSGASFVEITTLMWILGFLSSRCGGGRETQIRLPHKKDVRDFLRVWAFPEAVRSAVGLPLEDMVSSDDRKIIEEDNEKPLDKMMYAGKILKVDGTEQRLLSEGFFEFTTFVPRKETNPQRLAENENAKWREDRILAILSSHLAASGNTVSSHIVHEAMMNALRHPNCRVIQTASFFDRPKTYVLGKGHLTQWREFFTTIREQVKNGERTPGQRVWKYIENHAPEAAVEAKRRTPLRKDHEKVILKALNVAIQDREFWRQEYFAGLALPEKVAHLVPRVHTLRDVEVERVNRYILSASFPGSVDSPAKGHFTIVYRDDGESTVETLRNAITSGKQIRSVSAPELEAGYGLIIEDEYGQKSDLQRIRSDFTPDSDTSHEIVLMSALFPGITRDVKGHGHVVHPDVKRQSSLFGMPGMGLYVLTNEAVDVFGGSVSIRTKRYFLNIQAADSELQKDGIRYAVKVKKYGDWSPEFRGNMLTIRLPLG